MMDHISKQQLLLIYRTWWMNMKNNSKYYYVSNENMSNIMESIEEYSNNFEKESQTQSRNQSISEDIEYSRTNKLASQSIAEKNKSKKSIRPPQPPPAPPIPAPVQEAPVLHQTRTEQSESHRYQQPQQEKAYNLGYEVWQTIHQRYFDTNKISTEDPSVLYEFFMSQRKIVKPRSEKVLKEEYAKLQKLMPSMQRKMQLRLDFQRMLIYRPNDVYYTLQVMANYRLKERETAKNQNILTAELKKTEKKQKPIKEIVNRLYYQQVKANTTFKTGFKDEELRMVKLREFGKKLSEAYQNAMRDLPQNQPQTLSKLHHFWSQLYDRQQYGLEWDQEKAEDDIRRYMIDQVENLKSIYQRKIGYKQQKGNKLFKFLVQNPKLPDVYIPPNSFQGYVDTFNLDTKTKQQHENKILKENQQKMLHQRTKSEVKKFGRPVSATPLAILSKPKATNDYTDLYTKYGKDKLVQTLMLEDKLKMHRYPFEYGVYDVVEQLKIKGRVKPTKTEDYDDAINKMLTKTIANQSNFEMTMRIRDRVSDLLQEENLYKNESWKEMGPLLREAMMIKSFEEEWFRDPIVKYLKQTTQKDLGLQQDKVVFNELFLYLDKLEEDDRQSEISKLERFISISRSIESKNKEMRHLENKDQKYYLKERRLMYADLVERAIHFMKLKSEIKEGKTDQKMNKREFLNQTFDLLLKSHKDAVVKYFNVVEVKGDKECPKLLRYEFYRLTKEINPFTFQRDEKPKAPTWIATKNSPQSFNYKTHNKFANVYKKNKNVLLADPQDEKRSSSLWGQKKGKERQRLMMTYNDAKQCYFHPKVKKMD